MHSLIKKALWSSLGLAAALHFSPLVWADDASDAGKLYRAGQLGEALKKIDSVLSQKPKDAQMRFLKGIILTEQNKSNEAINVFLKLTEDYPELPEPYNNLAVLYASSGQYLKASAALEMAIRTNPTYATAHENLGDVYTKLASQSYDKALQIDSANPSAKLKLNLVKNLIGNTTGGTVPKSNTPPTPTVTNVIAANASSAPAKASASTKVEAKPDTPSTNANNDNQAALTAVENWAHAWSSQDVKLYLSYYAKDFETPKGESRSSWADDRRKKIEGKGKINVKIDNPSVTMNGDTATIKFQQHYTSDQISSNGRKTLVLVKQNGKWLIKQERSGS